MPNPINSAVQKDLDKHSKKNQKTYFDNIEDGEFEINRPHGTGRLYSFLLDYKFSRAVKSIPCSLDGKKVLNVCCGSGMDAEFLAKAGATVTVLDISEGAVRRANERARRFGFQIVSVVGDVENIPFADKSFDVVFVHDGLHHLSTPYTGIREMARVSNGIVVLIEPAKAMATKLAVKIGFALEHEESGNFVYRFSKTELRELFESLSMTISCFVRYFMYYHHKPTKVYRLFDNPVLFRLAEALFYSINAVVGGLGNKMCCVATKNGVYNQTQQNR